MLILDGSHGEGGGQILRTTLSLAAITGRAVRMVNIRAARPKPGLAPQHLSAVRAVATVIGAAVSGADRGSIELTFTPDHAPRPGRYRFDVAEISGMGSAGSAILVLQAVLLPLALSRGASTVIVRGGTHVDWSPPYDHFADAYLPALRALGILAEAELTCWGWRPVGEGEVICHIGGRPDGLGDQRLWIRPMAALSHGPLVRIGGRAVAANLPAHIPQRMADRAAAALRGLGAPVDIRAERVTAACPGAGIFLHAEYETLAANFSALGQLGKSSEAVADEAVEALRAHHLSEAAIEPHLADQLLLPLALAGRSSVFTVAHPTSHLTTNAWVVGQFGIADIVVERANPCRVWIEPKQRSTPDRQNQ